MPAPHLIAQRVQLQREASEAGVVRWVPKEIPHSPSISKKAATPSAAAFKLGDVAGLELAGVGWGGVSGSGELQRSVAVEKRGKC